MENNGNSAKRLASIDVLRGFDMFFIMGGGAIIISFCKMFNAGWVRALGAQFRHAAWNGFTVEDMIFPLFLFIAGISFPFSFAKSVERGASLARVRLNILKRCAILVVFGVIYNNGVSFDFHNMRFYSVLGRIGLAWACAAMLYTMFSARVRLAVAAAIPLVYWLISSLGDFTVENNMVAVVDRALSIGVLYEKVFDPEGLLSTLPAVSTAMLGIFAGEIVRREDFCEFKKVGALLAVAAALIAIGLLWDNVLPLNKKLWTSSYVCVAGGISYALFGVFYLVIDALKIRFWTFFFTVIGMNSITVYMAQKIIDFYKVRDFFFKGAVVEFVPDDWRKFALAVCYSMTVWAFLYILYRRKIFLKI